MPKPLDAIIIGAGISGLTAAYSLQKKGQSVKVLEVEDRPGGLIQSEFKDGFLIEHGPNTIDASNLNLIEELNLKDEILDTHPDAPHHFTVLNGKLVPMPRSSRQFIFSPIFSHACDPFGRELYPKFKHWADEYFFLKHRNEPRGIGGIFFDDFNTGRFENDFAFMQSVGSHYTQAIIPIIERRKDTPYTDRERNFQLYRRGRYVEFNLIYDRGTLFGLQSNGRTESILMSLPPVVRWEYNWSPEANTPEYELYNHFLKPQDWLAEAITQS